METPVFFETNDRIRIQGMLNPGSETAVAIMHPHPLYGGNMDNYVVQAIADACQAAGCTTLRFNFRGVGESGGTYGAEKTGVRDASAAVAFLEDRGCGQIHLAGYSFGAWVIAHTRMDDMPPGRVLMVAPPAAFMDFDAALPCSRLKLAVTGSADEIAPPAQVRSMLAKINPAAELHVIKGADHFFSAGIGELTAAVGAFLHI